MPWTHIIDELCDDPLLSHLQPKAAESIIRVLAFVLYADTDSRLLELVEFEKMMSKLPFFEGKDDAIRAHVAEAQKTASEIHDEDAFISAIESSAKVLKAARDANKELAEPRDIRNYVFTMAATLAAVDGEIHEHEDHTLTWLAHAFGIDEAAQQRLIESALHEHT